MNRALGATSGSLRLIESDAFEFEFVSDLAEMESWRKEVYRPIYHTHKWWAKRLGSVFRAIVLGSALPASTRLPDAFYLKHNFAGRIVFDPFMGSGTTIGEAHKLGFTTFGRDINPVACEAVRVALGPLKRDELVQAFRQLSTDVGERIRNLYETTDKNGHRCEALYYFWVKILPCPSCSASVDLFSTYVFARNAYPNRKPDVRIYCPYCNGTFTGNVNAEYVTCTGCKTTFNPRNAPASGATATCSGCKHAFAIAKTLRSAGQSPAHRLFAKLVLTEAAEKQYLPVSDADIEKYNACSVEVARGNLELPTLNLEDGHNTRQAINYGYRSWHQFFNARQLLALGWLREAILKLNEATVRDALLTVFSGALEFNNLFASYKGEGTGAIRHMFSHHILKPERVPIEGNVWGNAKSSGAFSTLFKSRILRAIEYQAGPFEIAIDQRKNGKRGRRVYGGSDPMSGCVITDWPPRKVENRAIYLSCGNSARSGLQSASVDLIITDPPFFDNVHYSELADFFFAWQQLAPTPFANGRLSTRDAQEVQDISAEQFAAKLQLVFKECRRVLSDDGLLVFTYHHSRSEGWLSLAEAVLGAGFFIVNCHPVKAEMSGATPKSQAKEPIQLDVILVCRKQLAEAKNKLSAQEALDSAIERARKKAERLQAIPMNLSANDRRVLLIGQFLVAACPGRSVEELVKILGASFGLLDDAASRLVETAAIQRTFNTKLEPSDPQMQLL